MISRNIEYNSSEKILGRDNNNNVYGPSIFGGGNNTNVGSKMHVYPVNSNNVSSQGCAPNIIGSLYSSGSPHTNDKISTHVDIENAGGIYKKNTRLDKKSRRWKTTAFIITAGFMILLFASVAIMAISYAIMTSNGSTTHKSQRSAAAETSIITVNDPEEKKSINNDDILYIRARESRILTYTFEMLRGYAETPEDVQKINIQRVPRTGGINSIHVSEILDIEIVCVVGIHGGPLSIEKYPWKEETPSPPPIPKQATDDNDIYHRDDFTQKSLSVWYRVFSDLKSKTPYLIISSYYVTDELYSEPQICNIIFTIA